MRLVYLAYSPLDLQSANSIQTYYTCRALAARLGEALTVIVPRFGRESAPPFRATRIPRIPFNKLTRVFPSGAWSYVERSVYAWLAWLYLVFQPAEVVYARDVICAFWLILLGRRVVYEVHDLAAQHPSRLASRRLRRVLARVDERTLRGARGVVSLTETFKRDLVERGWQDQEQVAVIPDAFDDAVYYPRDQEVARKRLEITAGAFVVGYAGMTFAYRRVDLLLEAMALVRAETGQAEARALIIGGNAAEVETLRRRAEELGLAGAVIWRGREPAVQVAEDLSAADVLVIPETVTQATASPLKMFEYLALGRPVVAVDRPALREILTRGTAEFFAAGEAASLAQALRALALVPARRAEMADCALARAREFTYERRAVKIVKFCEDRERGWSASQP